MGIFKNKTMRASGEASAGGWISMLAKLGVAIEIFKIALASGISWWIASSVTENPYPVFAPLAAILTTQVTIADSLEKSMYRIVGVIFGVTIGGFFGNFFTVNAVSVFIVIGLGLVVGNLLRLHPQITSQIGVSTLLVLQYGHSQGYMTGRIVETIIGAMVAVAINLLISPTQSSLLAKKTVMQSILQLTDIVEGMSKAEKTEDLAAALYQARQAVQQIRTEQTGIIQLVQGFRFTPFRNAERNKLKELALVMNRLEHISVQARGIARSLLDLAEAEGQWKQFRQVLHDVAICLTIFGRCIDGERNDLLKEALRMAVREMRGNFSRYFIELQQNAEYLVPEAGAIFSDLGRILDEIEDKFPDLNEKDVQCRSQHLGKSGTSGNE